ncbi:LamG domain-containing protein [Algisphaera agarilytica]|nr:LamG domain-containing protein [Algisphaera agarilytica]
MLRPDSSLDLPPRFETLEARQLCAVDLAGSLVAHWTFEDAPAAAVYADTSADGSDHSATPAGDADIQPQNRTNQTLHLDGAGDYLSAPNSSEINLVTQGQRTIAFWFRADDAELSSRKQIIFEEGGTTRGLNIYLYDGRVYVGGWNLPGSESNWAGTWLSAAGIRTGQWHHVALTLDGGATLEADAMRGYLDGQEFARGEGSQLWPHSGSITIGDHSDGTIFHDGVQSGSFTASFAGQLDDGRVYNRPLDASEVFTLARGPAASQGNPASQPIALSVHDIEYAIAPVAKLAPVATDVPESPDLGAPPVFPARATVVPDRVADPLASASQTPPADAGWPSILWWDMLAAMDDQAEQEGDDTDDQAVVEVEVDDAPLR